MSINRLNLGAVVSGSRRLAYSGAAQELLADDHAGMLAIGVLLDEAEPIGTLMDQYALSVARTNASWIIGR